MLNKSPWLLALGLVAANTAIAEVRINELRIDQPGADNDEYVELVGGPSDPLDGLTYLVIGDGTGASGVIESVTPLSGRMPFGGGFHVLAESTFSLGTADTVTSLNFENSDNVTHLLVSGFTGSNGDDLDTDDDGVLDLTPWTAIVDSVALVEDLVNGERVYSDTQVGPDGTFVPGHVYRCEDATGAFAIGAFDINTDDTPGAANACGDVEPEPEPETGPVLISEIRIDQPGSDSDEWFELTGTPGARLAGLSYLVLGDGTGGSGVIESVVDLGGATVDAQGYLVVAEGSFTLGVANLTANLNFENSDNVTHLVVAGFTGANGDDLDTNDDGVLDLTPWTDLLDSVALVESADSGDLVYSDTRVGPDGSFVPGHSFRCGDAFEIGAFDPADGTDTPGAPNSGCPVLAINELRIDQGGADNDEYFELFGVPGTALDGLTYLVIGDGTGGSGVIESVTDLTGRQVPASGFFLAVESTFTLAESADLITSLNFENSDNVTHLLVRDFTGANGDDLDTDDNGTLDALPWAEIVDSIALVESVGSGDQVYGDARIGPDGRFVPGHVGRCPDGTGDFVVLDFGAGVDDSPGAANACGGDTGGEVVDALIHEVQGSGAAVAITTPVRLQGVVTTLFESNDAPQGFFLQEEDADADAEPNTSEGIFVFCGACTPLPAIGDLVTVVGTPEEFFGMSQIDAAGGSVVIDAVGQVLPTAASVTLPAVGATNAEATFEALEGMLVTFPGQLVVSEYFNLARYGEVVLTADARPYQFTHSNAADVAGLAVFQADLATRVIKLDNLNNNQNADTTGAVDSAYPYPEGGLSVDNRFRGGDSISGLTGVMHWSFAGQSGTDAWRIRPVPGVFDYHFVSLNPATTVPDPVAGRLRVASFNVLNYFVTLDNPGNTCGPSNLSCRGANSALELEQQTAKIVAALAALDADVVGLIEIENDSGAAVGALVSALNALQGEGTWAAVDSGVAGTDAIRVAMIYRPGTVTEAGTPALLDSSVDPDFNDSRNRPALAQSFRELATGAEFTLTVNHLKSKGSSCDSLGDPDLNDGQANCNLTRTMAAVALADWLATNPTGNDDPDVLVMGDLNAYAMEDPIQALVAAGYSNLVDQFLGVEGYGFVFDGQLGYLDHALANASLTAQVGGVTSWHINADEVNLFDYNDTLQDDGEASFERKSTALPLYAPDALRSSDHDPVLVGLELDIPLPTTVAGLLELFDELVAAGELTGTSNKGKSGDKGKKKGKNKKDKDLDKVRKELVKALKDDAKGKREKVCKRLAKAEQRAVGDKKGKHALTGTGLELFLDAMDAVQEAQGCAG